MALEDGRARRRNAGGLVRCRKTWRPSPLKAEVRRHCAFQLAPLACGMLCAFDVGSEGTGQEVGRTIGEPAPGLKRERRACFQRNEMDEGLMV